MSEIRSIIVSAIKDTNKKSKKEVNYSKGMKNSRCGVCKYFISPDACDKVKGEIDKNYWCELFEAKKVCKVEVSTVVNGSKANKLLI